MLEGKISLSGETKIIYQGNKLTKAKVAVAQKINALWVVETLPGFEGVLDVTNIDFALNNGLWELTAPATVAVKGARWVKASGIQDGVFTERRADGPLQRPGWIGRMVKYRPKWLNQTTAYSGDDYELLYQRYGHASDRAVRCLKAMERAQQDHLLVHDQGGWPVVIFTVQRSGHDRVAELRYHGSKDTDPKTVLAGLSQQYIYCEMNNRYRDERAKRREGGFY